MRIFVLSKLGRLAFLFLLLMGTSAMAQLREKPLRNEVTVEFAGLSYLYSGEYIGPSIKYTFYPKQWIGLEASFTEFPFNQVLAGPTTGGPAKEISGALLVGKRFGRVQCLAKTGAGDFRNLVFYSLETQGSFDIVRNNPAVQIGGVVNLKVSPHWSAQYEVIDELVLWQQFTQYLYTTPIVVPGDHRNSFQASAGISFHF